MGRTRTPARFGASIRAGSVFDWRYPRGLPGVTATGAGALANAIAAAGTASSQLLNWQYPEGFYFPRKQPLRFVSHRPDSETGVLPNDTVVKSLQNVACPGYDNFWDVGINFGSWPYRVRIMQGPPGMYIGETYGSANYCRLVLPAASAINNSVWTVTLRVEDQQYGRASNPSNYEEVTYTLICKASMWLIMQNGGTYSDLANIWSSAAADSTKAVMMLPGNYNLYSNGSNEFAINNKPKAWTYPLGQPPKINFSAARFTINNQSQVWFNMGDCANSCQTLQDSHLFFFGGFVQDRCNVTLNSMTNLKRGSVGNDNPAAATFFNSGYLRTDLMVKCGELSDFSAPLIDSYGCSNVLVEGMYGHNNVWTTGGLAELVFLKAGNRDATVRNIKGRSLNPNGVYGNSLFLGGTPNPGTQKRIEVCYCDVQLLDSLQTVLMTNNAGSEGPIEGMREIWLYRNTLTGVIDQNNTYENNVWVENNVIVTNSSQPIMPTSGRRIVYPSNNVIGTTAQGILDANGKLAGTYKQYLGINGAELYQAA